ncbi:MAG: hypothetical protein KAT49_04840 [Methanomicrobia archaeon]|nr:hypothetical protein [Methanomicrobia archaeon]
MNNRTEQLKITDFNKLHYNHGYIPVYRGKDTTYDKFWEFIDLPLLCINYFTLRERTSLFKKCLKNTLADALGYYGETILVGVGQDIKLDKISNQEYLEDIRRLSPDYVTSLDTHTYKTDPNLIKRHQTYKAVDNALYLLSKEIECEVIPLVKGTNRKQISWGIEEMNKEFNIKSYMFPCQELSQAGDMKEIYVFLRKMNDLNAISFLYGFNNPKRINYYIFPDYICGSGYFMKINDGKVYYIDKYGRFQLNSFEELEKYEITCNLECCKGKIPEIENKKQLAAHNICVLNEMFQEEKRKRGAYPWGLKPQEVKVV